MQLEINEQYERYDTSGGLFELFLQQIEPWKLEVDLCQSNFSHYSPISLNFIKVYPFFFEASRRCPMPAEKICRPPFSWAKSSPNELVLVTSSSSEDHKYFIATLPFSIQIIRIKELLNKNKVQIMFALRSLSRTVPAVSV